MKITIVTTALSALAHDGRLTLFRLLVQAGDDGLPAGALAKLAKVNLTTSSAQLGVLTHAGLISGERHGRSIIYRARYDQISQLLAFLMEDCCAGRDEILQPLAGITNTCTLGETQ